MKVEGGRRALGLTQHEGTGLPAFSASRSSTAPARELTLIRRIPAGTAPAVSGRFAAGGRKIVAPAAPAPSHFCLIPPVRSPLPVAPLPPAPPPDPPPPQF